jgi:hypothetical protein
MKCDKCNKIIVPLEKKNSNKISRGERCECSVDQINQDDSNQTNGNQQSPGSSTIEENTDLSSPQKMKRKPSQQQSILLSTIQPDLWVGLNVRVQKSGNTRDEAEIGTVIRSGNGWVQLKTKNGSIAKRAYHLELIDNISPEMLLGTTKIRANSIGGDSKRSDRDNDNHQSPNFDERDTYGERNSHRGTDDMARYSQEDYSSIHLSPMIRSNKKPSRNKRKYHFDSEILLSQDSDVIHATRTRAKLSIIQGDPTNDHSNPLLSSPTQDNSQGPDKSSSSRMYRKDYYDDVERESGTVYKRPSNHITRRGGTSMSRQLTNKQYRDPSHINGVSATKSKSKNNFTGNNHNGANPTGVSTITTSPALGTSMPYINALLVEAKSMLVQKYVERHLEKIKDRPDLRSWLIKINSTMIDVEYEKSIARRLPEMYCKYCETEKWPNSVFCWNPSCIDSSIFMEGNLSVVNDSTAHITTDRIERCQSIESLQSDIEYIQKSSSFSNSLSSPRLANCSSFNEYLNDGHDSSPRRKKKLERSNSLNGLKSPGKRRNSITDVTTIASSPGNSTMNSPSTSDALNHLNQDILPNSPYLSKEISPISEYLIKSSRCILSCSIRSTELEKLEIPDVDHGEYLLDPQSEIDDPIFQNSKSYRNNNKNTDIQSNNSNGGGDGGDELSYRNNNHNRRLANMDTFQQNFGQDIIESKSSDMEVPSRSYAVEFNHDTTVYSTSKSLPDYYSLSTDSSIGSNINNDRILTA